MRELLLLGASLAVILATPAMAQKADGGASVPGGVSPAATPPASNQAPPVNAPPDARALLAPWAGPYGGLPPFAEVKVSAFQPALEEGMRENLTEVDAIANNPAPPTFDNTIAAQERAGGALRRVMTLYGVWGSTENHADMQAVQQVMDPRIAEFQDKISQNRRLFARIDAVYQARDTSGLTPEQTQLVWYYWINGVKSGARLAPAAKARVTAINQELAGLYAQFSQNLLADEGGHVLYLKQADLAGLPQSVQDAAAAAAADKGHHGEWAVLNTRSSVDPFLTYSDNRPLREQVWKTFYARGDNKDAHDNTRTIIPRILQLRAEKAHLMGFPDYASWKLQDEMAKTPDAAMGLMMRVWPATVARIHQEVGDMQALSDKEGAHIRIEPWDYRYYAEKVRKAKYDVDMNQVKPYLQLDHIKDGMFWAAGQLYGFQFVRLQGIPTYEPEMQVYEVHDRAGNHVGVWYFDPYARAGKNSGAWMSDYRPQSRLDGHDVPVIVSNNANFVKPAPGQPVLISWDDANTMFHEFGHALHGLNSNVTYESLASPSQAQDFVEFPSQLNENWLWTPEVLNRFAVNAQGQPIPPELVRKLRASQTFNTGFSVGEYLSAAIIDMKLHTTPQGPGIAPIDPDAFEKTELAKLGMPPEIVMRHRTPQFQHIFAGDAYAAGYYSYLWAEVLDHDVYEAFVEAGGPYDKATAKRLHDTIMQVGYTVPPAQAYRNFRGRDAQVGAYLRSKGFPDGGAK
ncbi:M3 family metallopeptidase [Caulobacter sp. S45]|uniref:M3 family metallopeptidase n=1 Tax=Caulobacter sp. S45 TaxID=1641861 RepID=UPI0015751F71|nr:M3 family metallopeptidase [Caulobacter sp. S45]